jgi:hypothetical protein
MLLKLARGAEREILSLSQAGHIPLFRISSFFLQRGYYRLAFTPITVDPLVFWKRRDPPRVTRKKVGSVIETSAVKQQNAVHLF